MKQNQLDATRRTGAAANQTTHASFENCAWQVATSFFLTGEQNSFSPATPLHPFKIGDAGWGAWELTARVGGLEIDGGAFPLYATANSAREIREWAAGVNWLLNKNVKASLNYMNMNTDFKGGSQAKGEVTADNEQAIFARVQLSF